MALIAEILPAPPQAVTDDAGEGAEGDEVDADVADDSD